MNYVYLFFNWIFGVFFLLLGFICLFTSPAASACFILISLLLLPPARKAAFNITNKVWAFKNKMFVIVLLFITGLYFFDANKTSVSTSSSDVADVTAMTEEARKEYVANEVARIQKINIEYFKSNKKSIISNATDSMKAKNYADVMAQLGKYRVTKDVTVITLYEDAQSARLVVENKAKTIALTEELRSIPATNLDKNIQLYKELVALNPEVTSYKEKVNYYTRLKKEKLAKEAAEKAEVEAEYNARVTKFGNRPTASAWDGSYPAVERHLKNIANDPDSIDISGCTKVSYTDEGWLVGCDYRGKNGFGSIVRQSNWFTIRFDQVVNMHSADTYKTN